MIRLSREQVRRIDRLAIERYRMPGAILMENAARGATEAAIRLMRGDCVGQVLILCGGGNNGGDGLAIARHLHNVGAHVHICLTSDPGKYRSEAKVNWEIVQAMGLMQYPSDLAAWEKLSPVLVIDAIFGTGLEAPPRAPFDRIVHDVASLKAPILSIDIPSGMDCDTGRPLGPCVRATHTVTFVAEKIGFAAEHAREWTGSVNVVDIGVPRELIEEVAATPEGT